MKIIDRYLTFAFLKIFLICFVSLSGLFIVIDVFTNLNAVMSIAEARGGMLNAIVEFYGPRTLDFFDRMTGALVLIAGIFSIALMQRRRELTAIEAAGIGKFRVVRPVLLLSFVVIALSVANREFLLPKYKTQLSRDAKNFLETDSVQMNIIKDHETGVLIRGDELEPIHSRITDAVIQLPIYLSDTISRMNAQYGYLKPAERGRPAGIMMDNVTKPENLMEMSSLKNGEEIIVYSPKDFDWLKPNQCFIASSVTPEQMAFGQSETGYESLEEMIASVQQPSQWYSRNKRVAIHSRILRPVLDMTLLLLGLPLIISQTNKNLFAAAGICVGVIAAMQLTILGCQSLGSLSIIKSAALSAWLPAIVFLPLATLSMRILRR